MKPQNRHQLICTIRRKIMDGLFYCLHSKLIKIGREQANHYSWDQLYIDYIKRFNNYEINPTR